MKLILPLILASLVLESCTLISDLMRKEAGLSPASSFSAVWTNMNPATHPYPRDFHALCYDSSNRIAVLFGGRTNDYCYVGDTWIYNYTLNTWSNMNPVTAPSIRHRHAMCFDSVNRKIILFGGDDNWYSNDTWAYDYTQNTWSNMNPTNPPPGRYYHSICFDSANHKVILFGGAGGGQYDDTWAYDYAQNTWSNMNPATHPVTRYLHSLSYDSGSQRVVLFGGRDNSSYFNDTWTYDYALNTWYNMNPSTHPSARAYYSMNYNHTIQKTVLFGGWDENTGLNDIWIYDYALNQWKDNTPAVSPPGRLEHTICYDIANNKIILFGGWTNNLASFGYSGDTWALTIQ